MIVAAITSSKQSAPEGLPLFDAIAAKGQEHAEEYRLVTQTDHARLSGAFATALDRGQLPYVDAEVLEAIATHDIGWTSIDGAAPTPILPPFDDNGRLRSFLTTPPPVFLQAWTGSIAHAERIGPTAGTMVSQHFERLAQFRLSRAVDVPSDVKLLQQFIAQEYARQLKLQSQGAAEPERLLALLQLSDVVSLYLCCGLESPQELGMDLGFGPISIAKNSEGCSIRGVPLREAFWASCPVYTWRPGSPSLQPSMLSVCIRKG